MILHYNYLVNLGMSNQEDNYFAGRKFIASLDHKPYEYIVGINQLGKYFKT